MALMGGSFHESAHKKTINLKFFQGLLFLKKICYNNNNYEQ
jgi:hypothetical protein